MQYILMIFKYKVTSKQIYQRVTASKPTKKSDAMIKTVKFYERRHKRKFNTE